MGNIYYGSGWGKSVVGSCEDGIIYKGTGWSRERIGSYDNKYIYQGDSNWSQIEVGCYEDGIIYAGTGWGRSVIGSYDDGVAYSGTGWSKDRIGEYDGSPAGAAALLLFSELQNEKAPVPLPPFPALLASIFGVVLLLLLVYHMYFTVKWKWANYAMFFTSIVSFVVTNIVLYNSGKEAKSLSEFRSELLQEGLSGFLGIGLLIAFIIYLVEQIVLKTLNFWMFLLGFIIAPVNFLIYAFPFLAAETIILLIAKTALQKKA